MKAALILIKPPIYEISVIRINSFQKNKKGLFGFSFYTSELKMKPAIKWKSLMPAFHQIEA
ncbi:hypothetical protein D770_02570 [Flammeovirgaceae bacterium 311]|nr:hypothetical protein D770_02570 [Flammeovirgaceae bacterium 311]